MTDKQVVVLAKKFLGAVAAALALAFVVLAVKSPGDAVSVVVAILFAALVMAFFLSVAVVIANWLARP